MECIVCRRGSRSTARTVVACCTVCVRSRQLLPSACLARRAWNLHGRARRTIVASLTASTIEANRSCAGTSVAAIVALCAVTGDARQSGCLAVLTRITRDADPGTSHGHISAGLARILLFVLSADAASRVRTLITSGAFDRYLRTVHAVVTRGTRQTVSLIGLRLVSACWA